MRTLDVEIAGPVDDVTLAPTGTTTRCRAIAWLTAAGGRIVAVATAADLGIGAASIASEGAGPVRAVLCGRLASSSQLKPQPHECPLKQGQDQQTMKRRRFSEAQVIGILKVSGNERAGPVPEPWVRDATLFNGWAVSGDDLRDGLIAPFSCLI